VCDHSDGERLGPSGYSKGAEQQPHHKSHGISFDRTAVISLQGTVS
jgi:hypothetical protein